MEEAEMMYFFYAVLTKEVDSNTVNTTVNAILMAQFALSISEDPSALKPDNPIKSRSVGVRSRSGLSWRWNESPYS